MNDSFIELDRRFDEYLTDETPESQAQRSYTAAFLGHGNGLTWDELLHNNRLVVILGEPGSGKTQELKARYRRLQPTSFFLQLDRLVSEDVYSILEQEEIRQLEKWRSGNYEVTFFLDAVDESKIKRDDDFFTALDRVKKTIGPSLIRARFVISSRISEWRPQTDLQGVLQRFGIDTSQQKAETSNGTRPSTSTNLPRAPAKQLDEKKSPPPIMVVTLLPLTPAQVERYASVRGIVDSQGFIFALEENNAWSFAGRPLDVSHLDDYWNGKGHLGSLTDLTEYMVNRLLAEVPDKEKQDPLSPEQTRIGAEHLAAAVILCRCLKIKVSDGAVLDAGDMISPTEALPLSWRPRDCRSLTDRALFDAASHGAISFHHRYHTEYLAAAWIERLMANNCGQAALEELLFALVDGQYVLRPTLAPVAAWLITSGEEPWRVRLAELLLQAAPEIHLLHGDPAVLPLNYRRRILNNLIERYQGRSRAMLSWNRAAMARLANVGLVDDLNRYLLDPSIAEDLRSDLLMVVREGKLLECVPAALTIIADPSTSENLKSYAAIVVRDIGNADHRQQLAESCTALTEISNSLLGELCEALFPQAITVDGLLALLRRSNKVSHYSIDLPYVLRKLFEQSLDSCMAVDMLRGLLELLKTIPLLDKPKLSEQFLWVTSLIPICLQKLLTESNLGDEIYDLAIASILILEQVERYDSYVHTNEKEDIRSVQKVVATHPKLRSRLFWERVARYRRKHGKEPEKFELNGYGTLVPLSQVDADWLLTEGAAALSIDDRRLAIRIAADLLWAAQQPLLNYVWRLLRATEGDSELVAICCRHTWNRLHAPITGLWLRHIRYKLLEHWWWGDRLRKIKRLHQKIHDAWWLWRHQADLRKGLYPQTLSYFARLVAGDNSNQYGSSDWDKASQEWGKTIASAAKQGCMVAWSKYSPPFPYEKTDRNSVNINVVVGLVGLQTLWRENHLDFSGLSAEEVELTMRYACNELNGFPEWFPQLSDTRPIETCRSLEKAISGEWLFPENLEHVHDVVSKLAWMPHHGEAVTKAVFFHLQTREPLNPKILEYATAVLLRSEDNVLHELAGLASIRIGHYSPEQAQWLTWMSVWLQLDALPALNHLDNVISDKSATDADELVIRLCSAMSGRMSERQQVSNPAFLELQVLARLIPLVHRHVRASEDIERANQGVYSPGIRDHAQDFRSRLWEALKNQPSLDTDEVLQAFLVDPAMTDRRDWILHLLDSRKSLRVDDVAWEAGDIRVFVEQHCSEPRSDYQLFRLASRLLKDIKNHVERSENATNRLQVRSDDLEKEFQGFLARELSKQSLNWFLITQESTGDLEQRPDIRVDRQGLNPVPIEVKLANLKHWSLSKLVERLENQLVGQYLHPASVRHGIYVLGNTDPKRSWIDPISKNKLNFSELVSHIQNRAAVLQSEQRDGIDGIEVVGIDFSDPRER